MSLNGFQLPEEIVKYVSCTLEKLNNVSLFRKGPIYDTLNMFRNYCNGILTESELTEEELKGSFTEHISRTYQYPFADDLKALPVAEWSAALIAARPSLQEIIKAYEESL